MNADVLADQSREKHMCDWRHRDGCCVSLGQFQSPRTTRSSAGKTDGGRSSTSPKGMLEQCNAYELCPSWTGDVVRAGRSGDVDFSIKRPPADPRLRLHCHSAHFCKVKSKQSEQESKDFVCEQGTKLEFVTLGRANQCASVLTQHRIE